MSRAMLGPVGRGMRQVWASQSRSQPAQGPLGFLTAREGARDPEPGYATHEAWAKPTFEVKEEGEPVGHHGSLAAHHAIAQECLGVPAQRLRRL